MFSFFNDKLVMCKIKQLTNWSFTSIKIFAEFIRTFDEKYFQKKGSHKNKTQCRRQTSLRYKK